MAITSNVASIIRGWERRAKALEPEMRVATNEATKTVYAESRNRLTKDIYDKPIPTVGELQRERMGAEAARGRLVRFVLPGERPGRYKTGGTAYKRYGAKGRRIAWKRTGNLRKSERYKIISPYEGQIINDASRKSKGGIRGYARARHNMGYPGHRTTRFPAHWRDEAVESTRDRVREIYRRGLRRAMQAGIIQPAFQ